MCYHPNSHTHRPWTHVENTATYDTNSQVQRHKILGAASSSKKLSHSVKQSLILSSSTYAFGPLVVRSGESGSVRFGRSNTINAPHSTGYVPLFILICLRKTITKLHTNVSQEWVRFYWARNAGRVWSSNDLCSFLKNSSLRRLRVSGFAASDDVLDTQCREHQKSLSVARSV